MRNLQNKQNKVIREREENNKEKITLENYK